MGERLRFNPDFRPLKIGGRGAVLRTSYWLGRDHLLAVEIGNYIERYRRFYFHDIQVVLMQRNRARNWWSLGFAALALVPFSALLYGIADQARTGWQDSGGLILVILSGSAVCALLVAGVVNTLRGPTCSVYLRTAVQTRKLHGVTRWRKAERLVGELTPLLHAAQRGVATAESRDLPAGAAASPAPPANPAGSNPVPPDSATPSGGIGT
jgi:hypothetical protein